MASKFQFMLVEESDIYDNSGYINWQLFRDILKILFGRYLDTKAAFIIFPQGENWDEQHIKGFLLELSHHCDYPPDFIDWIDGSYVYLRQGY